MALTVAVGVGEEHGLVAHTAAVGVGEDHGL